MSLGSTQAEARILPEQWLPLVEVRAGDSGQHGWRGLRIRRKLLHDIQPASHGKAISLKKGTAHYKQLLGFTARLQNLDRSLPLEAQSKDNKAKEEGLETWLFKQGELGCPVSPCCQFLESIQTMHLI